MFGFVLSKSAARRHEPIEDLPQHFVFDASSESLTLLGVDITHENSPPGLAWTSVIGHGLPSRCHYRCPRGSIP